MTLTTMTRVFTSQTSTFLMGHGELFMYRIYLGKTNYFLLSPILPLLPDVLPVHPLT